MKQFFSLPILAGLAISTVVSVALAIPSLPQSPGGKTAQEKPAELVNIGIDEKLDSQIDLNLSFKNEAGETVTLGQFFDQKRPVVLSLIYFSCPGLCNFHLNGVIDGIKKMDWSVGKEFDYVVVSFDPKENSELATQKKATYMKLYHRPGTEKGWHFLTADQASIDQLTQAVGFKYEWKEETQEWAHASAAIMVTPQGKISRYLHGISFEEKNFKLALSEAASGKIGTFVDQLIWYCFHYDPLQSKYVIYAANIMKIAGALMVLLLAAFLIPAWVRAGKEK